MIKLIKYLYTKIKYNICLQILAFIFTVIYSITIILSPIASEYLINKVLNTTNANDLRAGIIIFFVACILQPLVGFIKDIIFANLNFDISLLVSKKMFNKIINSKISFLDTVKSGDIISRINNDGNNISNFIGGFIIVYIKDLLVILFTIIGMSCISIKITLIIGLLLFINLFINNMFDKKFKDISSEIVKNNDDMFSYINQTVNSIVSIKTFNNEEKVKQKYNTIIKKVVSSNKHKRLLNIYINNLNNFIGIFSLSIIYGFGALEILNGKMNIGQVIGLGLYFQLVLSPLDEFVNNNIQLSSIKPLINRLDEYLCLDEEMYNNTDVVLNKNETLAIKNLTFSYKDKKILDNINIVFPKKGLVAIVGESGEGKSTLLKLLFKFYEPNYGNIYLGENSYDNIDVKKIRKYISLVNQDICLFNMSIKDNIKYANEKISENEIINLCKKVNLHNSIMQFDNGYNTIINEKLNLSGGEKQRLGIAMILSRNPNILIFDEPTSSLDFSNELLVMNILKDISKEKLVILVSHKESSIKFADKIYSLKNKKLILEDKQKYNEK